MTKTDHGTAKPSRTVRIGLLAVVVATLLVAAACGSGSDTTPATSEVPTIDDPNGLPLAETDADAPIVAGMCAPDEPDCEDTVVVDQQPQDLPAADEDAETTSSTMVADDGLSVSEALTTDASGIVAVRGHLFDDGSGLRFCEGLVGLGERYGCEGRALPIAGLDVDEVPDVVFLEGTTYTELEVVLFGEVVDGVLVVSDTNTG